MAAESRTYTGENGSMLRIGVVGAGTRGRMYVRVLAGLAGVEVAGIAEPVPESAERARRELSVPTFPSHAELYEQAELDAVIVATPDFAHLAPAVDAAHQGLHLLIEKPLSHSREEAVSIQTAVQSAGVGCMVAFENRWNPAFVRAREAVNSGALGEVLVQTARLSNPYLVPASMLSWSARSSPGWFLMPHTVDLALWLSGKQPVRLYATGFKRELVARGIDTWDAIQAVMTFEDGTWASLESLWILPDSSPSIVDFKYQLVGSRGALSVDQHEQGVRMMGDAVSFPGTLSLDVDGRPRGFAAWMVESFVQGLLEGKELSPGVEQGVLVTQVVQAIHQSVESGTIQQLT